MQVKKHVRLTMTLNDSEYKMLCAGLRLMFFESCLTKKERELVTNMLSKMEFHEAEIGKNL